ncbi:DUF5704 domain-containing protein [Paenibacillus sp. JX-17]|uniref:DUF5704 domain-containing protein n=1 Tax=Paenibacillus lacisoli TaxID=3064525 RepID=A0ABT9CCU7_9BACL|nr:DUF5704 domain-containing protein [Paenibacillus sp. JX-17]MDO7905501.1 DUF5704 domain-containing protein [Paenibacillus sp. JX-17]
MDIIWEGDLTEEKEIDVAPDATIKVNATKQLTAKVKTKNYGSSIWETPIDVSSRTETKWWSSDDTIAKVSSSGLVTAQKPGKVTVRAIWNNGTYLISDTAEITVTAEPGLALHLPDNACTSDRTPKQASATLTKPDKSTITLTAHPSLTWTSSNPAVASIGRDGKITAAGLAGITEITGRFVDASQAIDSSDTQTYTAANCTGGGGGGPGGPDNACSITIGSPVQGAVNQVSFMNPNATGAIKADQRGAEQFDVFKGIPTSENLYANIFGLNYLVQHRFGNMRGQVTYTVPVKKTYVLTWKIKGTPPTATSPGTPDTPQQDTQVVEKKIQITRNFSYWKVDNLEVYRLGKAAVSNYALPNGGVTLRPANYTAPEVLSSSSDGVKDHVQTASCSAQDLGSETKDGGYSRPSLPNDASLFTSKAESAVGKNQVKNDMVSFNGNVIMNPSWTAETAPSPVSIPAPSLIGQDVLYGKGYTISKSLTNKLNTASSGTIYYYLLPGSIQGGSDKSFTINGLNTVTVHTPVVIYASISDDQQHNQKTNPAASRSAAILDRPFTIYMPTDGQHRNIPGYGNRDYAAYVREKQVWFPFDVYNGDKSRFYPKNSWITIPVDQKSTTFFMPVWVDEGYYNVLFRTIAENAPTGFTTESQANKDFINHTATDVIAVDVIGRLYDFHITDIADYNWETVFRSSKGISLHTGQSYWTGLQAIDGQARGNSKPFMLPILPGSHPQQGFKNISIKTGYHFKFDLKTKGNMFGTQDGIRITPQFYFVSRNGSGRVPVDLYTHVSSKNLIKIGSAQDREKRYVILNDRLRNVPSAEMKDTAHYTYNHLLSQQDRSKWTLSQYVEQYVSGFAKQKIWIGRYDWLVLPAQLRTLIGPKTSLPEGVNVDRANASIQRWYGEYSLPADVYAVKQGTDLTKLSRMGTLDERNPVFLRDGYIIVNFNLETLREGNAGQPHLQYIHAALMNQWRLEGGRSQVQDSYFNKFNLLDGDVVFYHADHSSRGDFASQVPH